MPRNGYWIECVPVREQENVPVPRRYSATSRSFPEIAEQAESPDQAIEKLRMRLKAIRSDYERSGRLLPESDNPVRPPDGLRNVSGWISVYVDFQEKRGA
jgi:predicted RNase H-like HicB family nuclease